MKVEYRFAARAEARQRGSPRRQMIAVYYFASGETVGPGRYLCTFCGTVTTLAATRALPPCRVCDSAEYSLEAAA